MQTGTRTIAAVLGALALTLASCSSSTESRQETTQTPSTTTSSGSESLPVAVTPVIASVVAAPVPVPATDGKTHLAYELQLTNTLGQDVTLTSVTVLAGDQTLLTLAGDKLGVLDPRRRDVHADNEIGPGPDRRSCGSTSPSTTSAAVPTELVHTVGITVPKPTPPLIPGDHRREDRAGHRVRPASRRSSRHRWTARTGWTATAVAT